MLVARSFGAWLLLNALTERAERIRAPVVLLAPVLGYGRAGGVGLIAPRAVRFWRQVDAGLPMPASTIAVLAAADDEQCPLDLQQRLARHWAIERHELPGAGHGIGLNTALAQTRVLVRRVLGAST